MELATFFLVHFLFGRVQCLSQRLPGSASQYTVSGLRCLGSVRLIFARAERLLTFTHRVCLSFLALSYAHACQNEIEETGKDGNKIFPNRKMTCSFSISTIDFSFFLTSKALRRWKEQRALRPLQTSKHFRQFDKIS